MSVTNEPHDVAPRCAGRTVVITGAGRGIGRAHALTFAAHGAQVVVNDLGTEVDGRGASSSPADLVVAEIEALGGYAVANYDDIASWEGARNLIGQAVEVFGTLDTLVCNAGTLRDRMLVNMTEDDWDGVITTHLKGHFCPLRHAATHWRERSKQGERVAGRVIMTSSGAGLFGNVGQINYAAAKAGIAAMARTAAAELARYDVTVNAIGPLARSRMTGDRQASGVAAGPDAFDPLDPFNISPVVVWLGSDASADVSGEVFEVYGGGLGLFESWQRAPAIHRERRWQVDEIGEVVPRLLAAHRSVPVAGTPAFSELLG